VFTARYALSPYIKQIRFVFKGLREGNRVGLLENTVLRHMCGSKYDLVLFRHCILPCVRKTTVTGTLPLCVNFICSMLRLRRRKV
jgi:hypothetical protein